MWNDWANFCSSCTSASYWKQTDWSTDSRVPDPKFQVDWLAKLLSCYPQRLQLCSISWSSIGRSCETLPFHWRDDSNRANVVDATWRADFITLHVWPEKQVVKVDILATIFIKKYRSHQYGLFTPLWTNVLALYTFCIQHRYIRYTSFTVAGTSSSLVVDKYTVYG